MFAKTLIFISLVWILLIACKDSPQKLAEEPVPSQADTITYTTYSHLPNHYQNFHSPNAINHIADIENTYFRNYESGLSRWYGTVWREYAEANTGSLDKTSLYYQFVDEIGHKGDSMHCTIYAVEALKAGMGIDFEKLQQSHRRVWKKREHAGWSIGYLLVKEWGWKAYLILDRYSEEFEHCLKAYRRKRAYPVWRQPDIPLEKVFIRGEDNQAIQQLLNHHEFGWGFSHQGIHTWITRFDKLKECNWLGAPGKKYETWPKLLFITTPFLQYYDYDSHIVIFPPRKTTDNLTL